MKVNVCDDGMCTSCGSCIQICPQQCIFYINNNHETSAAVIDTDKCISCNLCKMACPTLNNIAKHRPMISYAAWSNDSETRRTSASGGIASEMYHYFGNKDNHCYAGTSMDDSFDLTYKLFEGIGHIYDFKNSKYVYGDTKNVYKDIAKQLGLEKKILFIGLPCQVAGLKQYLNALQAEDGNLICVDLVCHGATPPSFLKEHVAFIEKKTGRKAAKITFRDPDNGRGTYDFILCVFDNKNKVIYKKKVHRNDSYQVGYHYGITYRDNCYKCDYTQNERVGDVTLADYSGLGTVSYCDYSGRKVSCILVNTEKGRDFIDKLKASNYIYADIRPVEEELNNEKQLNSPTQVTKERTDFIKMYAQKRDFEKSMKSAACWIMLKNELKYYLGIEYLVRGFSKISRIVFYRE